MKNIHNYNPRKKASAPNQSEDKYTQRKNKFDWTIVEKECREWMNF